MFDDEITLLLKRNSDVLEIQAEKLAQAARGIIDAVQTRSKSRVFNNIIIIKSCLRKINEEFSEMEFLIE